MVPKKLHFIWLGGASPLSPGSTNVQRLRDWLKCWNGWFSSWRQAIGLASGWEYNLWVDSVSIDANAKSQLSQAGFKIRDIRDLAGGAKSGWWRVCETELTGGGANFGAASDILRVAILIREGGVYSDLDNFPGKNIAALDSWVKTHDLGFSIWPDEPNCFVNAVLASSPGHDFMRNYLRQIVSNYEAYSKGLPMRAEDVTLGLLKTGFQLARNNTQAKLDLLTQIRNFNLSIHRHVERKDSVISISGPRALRYCIATAYQGYNGSVENHRWEDISEQVDTLRGQYGIAPDVIRVTSEGSWTGSSVSAGDYDAELRANLELILKPLRDQLAASSSSATNLQIDLDPEWVDHLP